MSGTTLARSWRERALEVTPGGVHSPVRAFRAMGCDPVAIVSARGARLTCADVRTDAPVGEASWQDTVLRLPADLAGARWRCALTGREIGGEGVSDGGRLRLGAALADFPGALLLAQQFPPPASP